MVDFKKKRLAASVRRPTNPREIYDRLDRASDKGPLRAAQERVLDEWNSSRRNIRDVILKLHTGQGKTLLGLLMLQSKLNERDGRALYLCPNLFLVNQTLQQAKQFGITCVPIEETGAIPPKFIEGKAILVTTIQKLFNGLTKFGLDQKSLDVDYIVMDDAHACIDAIRAACQIQLPRSSDAYREILDLFSDDLKRQGVGSFAEIRRADEGDQGPLLPVPYWAWMAREEEITEILAKNNREDAIKFAWPLIRDRLKYCQCLVSSREIAIVPNLPPLDKFRTYQDARHRIFMSATVTDDAFLIKGLGLSGAVVSEPLIDPEEKWSGEKMILMPSITSPSLDESFIIAEFGKVRLHKKYNVVTLIPSFFHAQGWEAAGAVVAKRDTLDSLIAEYRQSSQQRTLVIANRYDGIDLPDEACRILILDGKPYSEALWERYTDECRYQSEVSVARIARTIEQGLGRAVRGEKDYCVVLITSPALVRMIRSREIQKFLSAQTKEQVRLGIEISEEAERDIDSGDPAFTAVSALMRQCLERDDDWKEFYKERMDQVDGTYKKSDLLEVFTKEREAEVEFQLNRCGRAVEMIQSMVDSKTDMCDSEKGWYLQEMARYQYPESRTESAKKQAAAHKLNRLLLKPESVVVTKLDPRSQKRSASIIQYAQSFPSEEALRLAIDDITGNLRFGVRAEPFEKAWDDLGRALGFASERPDREWKEGPDNLWALKSGLYLLVECKSEVEQTRAQINKHEAGQMNNSCAWFAREYPGCEAINTMIIPTSKVTSSAGFNHEVYIMKQRDLRKFVHYVKEFFGELLQSDRQDLSEEHVHKLLANHHLTVDEFVDEFTSPVQVV